MHRLLPDRSKPDTPPVAMPPSHPASAGLLRDSSRTLTEQLVAQIQAQWRQGLLPPGSRLPSVREAARRHGVSPHTVVAAYDQLLALGLVEAQRQRGFFVRGASATPGPPALPGATRAAAGGRATPPVDATALIRGMFHGDLSRPAPGLGTLPSDWLDAKLLHSALRRVMSQNDPSIALQYGDPAGDPRLRAALARKLADVGVHAQAEQIITANGATQALDLISRALLTPGDAVLVDDPGWAVEFARLSQMGMQLLPVPRGEQGPDLAAMAALAAAHRPRLYVTVSVLHNPTGHSLSLASAHQILKLAEQHGFQIVEDDTYSHLAPPHLPRLSALDGLQRSFYVSGFSKILTPSWRVGYLAAPAHQVERLVDLKLLSGLTTPALLEQALGVCLEQGGLRRHAERVQARLDAARQRSVRLAQDHGCRFITPPQGLFGWVDTGCDTEQLARRLHAESWLLAPGHLFQASRQASRCMRINFATSQDARFWHAFEQARAAL